MADATQTVLVIPYAGPRVESGAVRFGDDCNGLFVRGDAAVGVLSEVEGLTARLRAAGVPDLEVVLATQYLREVADLIRRDVVMDPDEPRPVPPPPPPTFVLKPVAEMVKSLRDAGGSDWDKIADPEAFLRGERPK